MPLTMRQSVALGLSDIWADPAARLLYEGKDDVAFTAARRVAGLRLAIETH